MLDEKAGSLPGGERVTSLAHATAEKLSSTADYVREHNVNQMVTDVETLVKIILERPFLLPQLLAF